MTREQFARAARADEKWIENAARQLARKPAYTAPEARYMGFVRLLTRDFGVPLARAGELAESALRHPPGTRSLALVRSADGSVALVVDLARFHSTFAASLSAALHHATPRRRGRPLVPAPIPGRDPITAAAAYGIDVTLLRESLRRTPTELLESLDEDTAFLAALRPVDPSAGHGGRRAG